MGCRHVNQQIFCNPQGTRWASQAAYHRICLLWCHQDICHMHVAAQNTLQPWRFPCKKPSDIADVPFRDDSLAFLRIHHLCVNAMLISSLGGADKRPVRVCVCSLAQSPQPRDNSSGGQPFFQSPFCQQVAVFQKGQSSCTCVAVKQHEGSAPT